jgi:hypothetical protein
MHECVREWRVCAWQCARVHGAAHLEQRLHSLDDAGGVDPVGVAEQAGTARGYAAVTGGQAGRTGGPAGDVLYAQSARVSVRVWRTDGHRLWG